MRRHRTELPPFAKTYLGKWPRHRTERVVVLFHAWLRRTDRKLASLTPRDIEEFLQRPASKPVARYTRNDYRYHLRKYLTWLQQHGLVGPFDREELQGYHRKRLPDLVRRFLRFLAPTLRPATIDVYRSVLRRFHAFLEEQGVPIDRIDRDACLAWSHRLHERGLHPSTRVGHLVSARKYLDWLWEAGIIERSGRDLIHSSDLPKKPEYLPRPLPPEADNELQQRLRKSDSSVALGLYVMRRTGLRVGELRRLEPECIRSDPGGHQFLKVPLGKMHNERLVPLDDATLAVLKELKHRAAHQGAGWLLPGARGRPISPATYQAELGRHAADLAVPEHLTTHRLRHSFATTLLSGGMSFAGIMKLLGHRDHRMTLRYTLISDEVVGREYFEALGRLAERYELFRSEAEPTEPVTDPTILLQDTIRWITKHLRFGPLERPAKLLVRRLEAALQALAELRRTAEQLGCITDPLD